MQNLSTILVGWMNEWLFLAQILWIGVFTLVASKGGKTALVTWIVFLAFLANCFVLKQVMLFGLEVTASDAFALGSLLSLNLLQEKAGAEAAKQACWICQAILFFFAGASYIHLAFTPSPHDVSHTAFSLLFTPAPRLFVASLASLFLTQQVDIILFSKLKMRFPEIAFPIRAFFSLTVLEILDTVLFSIFGLYGIVYSVLEVILFSLIIKAFSLVTLTPFTRWACR